MSTRTSNAAESIAQRTNHSLLQHPEDRQNGNHDAEDCFSRNSSGCHRYEWPMCTEESELLIDDLKKSYGYTSDFRVEGFGLFSSSECELAADEDIGDICCRYRM
jgi:hypothetical protein